MSEQNTNAQLEAYRKLVDDFKRFVSSEIRAEENSYRFVDMTSEDAEIDDPSVPVTQLEDEKAEKLAGICMDLSNATLWLYYNRDKFANVEFMPLTDETLKEYQKQAQNALNEPKSPLYLKSWYQLIEMLSQECIPQRYEDDGQRYTDVYVNTYMLMYLTMTRLKNGGTFTRLANGQGSDAVKITTIAMYYFSSLLTVLCTEY